MAGLLAVSLVCATTIVNPQDCTRDTALDIILTPLSSELPSACMVVGQTAAAQAHVIDEAEGHRYVRVLCERRVSRTASAVPPQD
jgi:hypothetical protein